MQVLERFASESKVPGLRDCFTAPRQRIDLFTVLAFERHHAPPVVRVAEPEQSRLQALLLVVLPAQAVAAQNWRDAANSMAPFRTPCLFRLRTPWANLQCFMLLQTLLEKSPEKTLEKGWRLSYRGDDTTDRQKRRPEEQIYSRLIY